jgi:hypothetical protein
MTRAANLQIGLSMGSPRGSGGAALSFRLLWNGNQLVWAAGRLYWS